MTPPPPVASPGYHMRSPSPIEPLHQQGYELEDRPYHDDGQRPLEIPMGPGPGGYLSPGDRMQVQPTVSATEVGDLQRKLATDHHSSTLSRTSSIHLDTTRRTMSNTNTTQTGTTHVDLRQDSIRTATIQSTQENITTRITTIPTILKVNTPPMSMSMVMISHITGRTSPTVSPFSKPTARMVRILVMSTLRRRLSTNP